VAKKILEVQLLKLRPKSEGLNFSQIHKDTEASINPLEPPEIITKTFYNDKNVIVREAHCNNRTGIQTGTADVAVDYLRHFCQGIMVEEFSDIVWSRDKFWFTTPMESLSREFRESINKLQRGGTTYPFRNLRRFVQPPFGYLSEEEERFEKRDMLGWIFLVGLTEKQLRERIRITDRRYDIINNPEGRKKLYLGSLSNLHIGKHSTSRKMLRRCISQDWGIVVTMDQWNGFKRFKFRHSSAQLPGGPDLFHKICKRFARRYGLPYRDVEEKVLVGTLLYHLIGMYYRPGSRTDTTLCCSRSMQNATVISKYQANQLMGTYRKGVIQTNSFLANVKDSSVDNVDKSFFIGEKKSGAVLAEIHYCFSEARFRQCIEAIAFAEEVKNYKNRSRFSEELYQKLSDVIEIKDQFLVNLQSQPWIKKG